MDYIQGNILEYEDQVKLLQNELKNQQTKYADVVENCKFYQSLERGQKKKGDKFLEQLEMEEEKVQKLTQQVEQLQQSMCL